LALISAPPPRRATKADALDHAIEIHLAYRVSGPTDLLLQIEVADLADQQVRSSNLQLSTTSHFARVAAEEGLGDRIWLRTDEPFRCHYTAQVHIDRPVLDISALAQVPPHLLPGDTVRYLMPSRFCPSDQFQSFVAAEFGFLEAGVKIVAMRDWVNQAIAYVPGASNAQTSATDTFVERQGVCRDFAHLMITLARAATIPARFVSVYAPGVTPQDFHAVAEIFLDGTWHLVDATGMAPADSIARIGVGTDASEVAFLTSFGPIELETQTVNVTVMDG
jgi:transglutaminase-like putative cysteine protease